MKVKAVVGTPCTYLLTELNELSTAVTLCVWTAAAGSEPSSIQSWVNIQWAASAACLFDAWLHRYIPLGRQAGRRAGS